MIKNDIEKDIAKATEEEEQAKKAYDSFVADIDASIGTLDAERTDLEGKIASDMDDKSGETTARSTNQDDLTATLEYLKKLAPGCDYMAVHFETRLSNRQNEVDGLKQAKAVLKGAAFPSA